MKTIVLSNLKQVFETIMTLCNILQLRVLSHNKNIVVYSDLFNDEKIILLNKEYSEVIYHDYTNNVHVCYEINNSEKLFMEYYNRYENSTDIISKLNEVIEQLEKDKNNLYEEIDYLNERIETLKNCNYRMCNELGDCETKCQNMVDEISQLNNIIDDRNMVIETMKKTITEKENLINSLYNQISSIQYNNQSKIEEMRKEYGTLFNDFMNEYSQHSETLKENKELKKKIKRLYARMNKNK